MKVTDVIISPVITEKSSLLAQSKVYAFHVNPNSNKNQIAQTIEDVYGVEVAGVSISVRKGKSKRVGKRMQAKALPDTKLAYITLKKGTIDLFPQS